MKGSKQILPLLVIFYIIFVVSALCHDIAEETWICSVESKSFEVGLDEEKNLVGNPWGGWDRGLKKLTEARIGDSISQRGKMVDEQGVSSFVVDVIIHDAFEKNK